MLVLTRSTLTMETKNLENFYWQSLGTLVKLADVKAYSSSFMFMDTDAWIWSVQIYKELLRDYCKNPPFDAEILRRHIAATSRTPSMHQQAKKILALLGIKDEVEEGWWLKKFRYELDQASGKSGNKDKRSFMINERLKFLDKVKTIAEKVEFTSITLGLALIVTAHIRGSEDKRIAKILEVLPEKAEGFFLPKEHIILK